MKADKDGGIPALARPLERVVFAKETCMKINITWLKQACYSKWHSAGMYHSWSSPTWVFETGTIKEFSRELNKVFRVLVQSNMEGFSVLLVLQSELDCWSAGTNTSRTLEVGFLDEDSESEKKLLHTWHTRQDAGYYLWFM